MYAFQILSIVHSIYLLPVSVSAPNVTLILCPYICWSSLRFFLVQLILVSLSHLLLQDFFVGLFFFFFLLKTVALYFVGKYLEPLFSFCRLIASMLDSYYFVISYEARVRFGIRVRVRDSAIFEKGGCGCGCGRTRQLKNY